MGLFVPLGFSVSKAAASSPNGLFPPIVRSDTIPLIPGFVASALVIHLFGMGIALDKAQRVKYGFGSHRRFLG
jgi:hypothetical protein